MSAIGILSSCGSNDFLTACDCFHNYHEDNSIDQQFYAMNNPDKVKDYMSKKHIAYVSACAEKFGTNEFILQMHLSLKDKCDE